MNRPDKFWMVYGDGCRAPSHKHKTSDSACDEARRLAMQHRGTRFFVLEAKHGYVMPPDGPTRIDFDNDDMPF